MNDLNSDTRVVVALDHSVHWGVHDRFENPESTLRRVLEADPDGILAGVPFIRRFKGLLDEYPDVERVATLDLIHDSTIPGIRETAEIHTQPFSVSEAVRVGADAVKVAVVYGREREEVLKHNIEFTARAAEESRAAGVPMVIEPTLWGSRTEEELDPERLTDAARLAFELGADIVKSPYPTREFTRIGDDIPVPVYIAGGPATESDREFLEIVAGAVEGGARGVMFGRNIWQREDPARAIRAIDTVIGDPKAIDDAVALF